MSEHRIDRRGFLAGCAALPLVGPLGERLRQSRPWRINVVDGDERGTRIVIGGTIYKPDATTPAGNVKMFVYQTDTAGWYTQPVNRPRQARLRGTLWTDARGWYEFLTVEPAHYADTQPPPARHIHIHLEPPGLPNHWVDSFKFAGDPSLTAEDLSKNAGLGVLSAVMTLAAGEGDHLRARRDFRLDPALAKRNHLVNGWYRQ